MSAIGLTDNHSTLGGCGICVSNPSGSSTFMLCIVHEAYHPGLRPHLNVGPASRVVGDRRPRPSPKSMPQCNLARITCRFNSPERYEAIVVVCVTVCGWLEGSLFGMTSVRAIHENRVVKASKLFQRTKINKITLNRVVTLGEGESTMHASTNPFGLLRADTGLNCSLPLLVMVAYSGS